MSESTTDAQNWWTPSRLKRLQLAVTATMCGMGWDQMDVNTRSAAVALQVQRCWSLIADGFDD